MSIRQFPPLKFCFIPFYGAPSHSYSLTNIARYFAFHGQKITILATQYNYKLIQNLLRYDNNKDDDHVNGGTKIDVRVVSMPFEELRLTKEKESLITPYTLYFANELLRQSYEQILTKDGDERFDCVVADSMFGWTADFASHLRIPCVVSFNPYSVLYVCIKEVLRSDNHNNNQIYQSESFVVPGLPVDITMTKSELPPEEFCWVEEKLREGQMKCDFVLVNNFKELEPENVEFFSKVTGRKVFAIGPSSEINSKIGAKIGRLKITEDDEHYCLKWLDKKDPESVLYVCFGSIIELSDAQMVEIARALDSSGHNFIWVATRRGNMVEEGKELPIGYFDRIKGKGLVLKNWAPQLSILNHPSVGGFLTHCGWNSILEGIAAGVPMITWPLTSDQFCNEKLVTQGLGIGLPVGRNKWLYWLEVGKNLKGREVIELVVRKLMDVGDEKIAEMRKKAREYGKMAKQAFDDDNGGSTQRAVMDLFEEVRIKVENHTKN